jgi:uncharacterized protein
LLHVREGQSSSKRIAEGLTAHGIAVLRFDFTGLGGSGGEFANTHFLPTSMSWWLPLIICAKLMVRPQYWLVTVSAAARCWPPRTGAASYDPSHVFGLFKEHVEEIRAEGEAEVALAGRSNRTKLIARKRLHRRSAHGKHG